MAIGSDNVRPLRPQRPQRTSPAAALPDALGRPLHDLRISVMDRCNFRCPYCMPADAFGRDHRFLAAAEQLDFGEIERLARLFVGLGVRKLRLTGGEPLLRPDLPELVAALRLISPELDLALTTNGVLLAQQAPALVAAGLDRVTVSLDSMDETVFRAMSGGRGSVGRALAGIEAAREAGIGTIKINTVVQRGVNDHTVVDLVQHFRGSGIVVRLIEYMDVGTTNGWSRSNVVPSRELMQQIGERWPLVAMNGGYRGEVARRYAFADGQGEIGFISSVSEPFCGDCSRARLSSDGTLYTCLFAEKGTDLRALLRGGATDAVLRSTIMDVWQRRGDRYSEQRFNRHDDRRRIEMHYIGG
jgi:cyclic pyranopterin phosphate synthase